VRPPAPTSLPVRPEPAYGADITRDRLLQATHELLFERAGAEPSVSDICARAGVNVSMVSYCFGGKRALLQALVERTTGAVVAELDALAALDLPAEEKLRRHLAGVVRNYLRYPYVNQLGERLGHAAGPAAERTTAVLAAPMIGFYTGLLTDPAFRRVDPVFLFCSITGMCEFLFAARRSVEDTLGAPVDDDAVDRFVEHTVDLVLHGITSPSSDPPRSATA
jgi:AcrR family transcriptional regulator